MLGYTVQDGMVPTADPSSLSSSSDGDGRVLPPDVLVINTCGFLQTARDESNTAIAQALLHKQHQHQQSSHSTKNQNSTTKVIVTGCMANLPEQRDRILRDYPGVDAVIGSGEIDTIVETIHALEEDGTIRPTRTNHRKKAKKRKGTKREQPSTTTMMVEMNERKDEGSNTNPASSSSSSSLLLRRSQRKSFLEQGDTPRFLATPPHYAYLKIAEGCRKRCKFCVIPKLKGRLQSKPIKQIVDEFHAIVDHGTAREVILIAQDLGDYGYDFRSSKKEKRRGYLTELLRSILSSIDDDNNNDDKNTTSLFWLRLLYLYPDEIEPELIQLMKEEKRIARYLDMPIQHIHDDILTAMRRKTTSGHIKQTITDLRTHLPGIHFRTSLMVGFPGETEDHFEELLQFVRDYKLDHVGVFMYSNEEMAPSYHLVDQIPEDIKQDRYNRLMEEQWKVVEARHQQRIDVSERLLVVIEGLKDDEDGEKEGHTKSAESPRIVGRHAGQCPEIDSQVILEGNPRVYPGERYWVQCIGYEGYDLIGRVLFEEEE